MPVILADCKLLQAAWHELEVLQDPIDSSQLICKALVRDNIRAYFDEKGNA